MANQQQKNPPIACSLTESEAHGQLGAWTRLASACRRVESSPGVARIWFAAEAESELRSVAAREAQCCPFLDLKVFPDAGLVRLEIVSPAREAQLVIDTLARLASNVTAP